jgi:hypothetical protein
MGEPAVPSVYPPPVPSTANTKIEERRIETSGDLPVSVPIPPRHRLIIIVHELQPAVRDAQADAPVQQARDHQVACVAHDGLGAAKEVGPVHRAESAVQAAQVAKAEVGKDGFVTFGMADWAGLRTAGMASRAVAFGAAGGHLLEDCLMEGLDGSMGVV